MTQMIPARASTNGSFFRQPIDKRVNNLETEEEAMITN